MKNKLEKFTKNTKEIFKHVGLVAHLGLTMVICIVGFFFLGLYLDNKFNLGGLAIIFFIIFGIALGGYSGYKLIKQEDENRE